MKESRLVWQGGRGGYLIVQIDTENSETPIELHKKYWLGATKELHAITLEEVRALILNLKDLIDGNDLARKLLGVDKGGFLFHIDEKGEMRRIKEVRYS